MGTRFYALLPDLEEGKAERLFYHLRGEVNRIEQKMSRFLPESEVSRLNAAAAGETVEPDEELFDLLQACRYIWEKTDGAFDLTCRPLMEYWKDKESEADEDFQQVKDRCGFQHLLLDPDQRTAAFTRNGMEIDFGGLGKGYALEKIKEMILNTEAKSAFISFGESSVLALGEHPAGGAWKIGMNNYLDPGKTLHEFRLCGGSVSTSSNFRVNDSGRLVNHRHIIDPHSGKPWENLSAVSVHAESPLLAEMLSTACLVSESEKIRSLKEAYPEVDIVRADYWTPEVVVTSY